MSTTQMQTPETRARQRAKDFAGLAWHFVVFLLLNGGLWALDLTQAPGLDWAYWVTIFTGLAFVFHAAWYLIERSGNQNRRYERFLEQERRTDAS